MNDFLRKAVAFALLTATAFLLTAVRAGTADCDKAEATGSPMPLKTLADKPQLERLLPDDLSVVEFSR